MVVYGERGKPENSGKNLSEQSRERTNKRNPRESPLESQVVSKDKRVGKIRTHTRNSEYTLGEGSGEILSARVFFPLFFRSAKSKVTRRLYVTRHLSMRTTLNWFVLYLKIHLISNLLFFCWNWIRKHTVHIREAFLVVVFSPWFSYLSWHLIGMGDNTVFIPNTRQKPCNFFHITMKAVIFSYKYFKFDRKTAGLS